MVFAEIESQLRTEGGWNMHIAIALIMALLVTAGVLWFFFALADPSYPCNRELGAVGCNRRLSLLCE